MNRRFSHIAAGLAVAVGTSVALAADGKLPDAVPTAVAPVAAAPAANCAACETPLPAVLPDYGGPLCTRPKLTGDWCGTRTTLRDHGITFDGSVTQFYNGVTSGGVRQEFQYGGRADYIFHIDGEKAGLWKGFFIDLHGETNFGNSLNRDTGALLPTSLAQALPNGADNITVLSGVKFTQALSENFLVYFGKINTLDDFNQPFAGGRGVDAFQNTSLLFNPVYARTVPYSTFGAGAAVLAGGEAVFSVSVFDTNNTPTVTGFNTFFDNGASVVIQANLPTKLMDLPGHQGVGATYSSARYTTLDPNPYVIIPFVVDGQTLTPRTETGSWSLTYSFDQMLVATPNNPKKGWGLFGNAGIADGNPNAVRWFSSIGVGGASPFCGRENDSFGLGYFYMGVSESLKDLAPRLLPLGDEQGVELFYNVGVTPWCHITPDLQFITPSRSRIDPAVAFGVRAKIDF